MSGDFQLSEKAKDFDETLHECLASLFGIEDNQADKEDIQMLTALKLAHISYVKEVRKQAKKQKAKLPLQSPKSTVVPENFTSVEDFSTDNSIFCDLAPLFQQMYNSAHFRNLTEFYEELAADGSLDAFLTELSPCSHLLSLGLNRTIIDMKTTDFNDEVLLNATDIFQRIPQYALFLDLSKVDDKELESEDGRITGISLQRTTLQWPKKGLNFAPQAEKAPYLFDGISVMFCVDNTEYFPIGVCSPLDNSTSVFDMLLETMQLLEPEDENDTATFNVTTTDGQEVELSCSETFWLSTKRALGYATYAIAHQNEIVDAKGVKVALSNNDWNRMVGTQPMSALAQKDLPFVHYSL